VINRERSHRNSWCDRRSSAGALYDQASLHSNYLARACMLSRGNRR